ncbi:hypothetical protein [Streptomyces sp. AK04-3B]|uniref:hypothetical protein n=1 Tax=Streptomyces sp. AK04-3B TaxID=3028650 RepID=UPI0029A9B313|nr:hypothetical protein [Streptomyces sp. AK04-3B]MDX3804288.1 hypothetical protein [Streptomyces sp. AK04-3B]
MTQEISRRAVILGHNWSGGTAEPLLPGQSKFFADRILSPVHDAAQVLRSLTVTATASQHADVRAVGVTDLTVVTEPDGHIGVNFNVTNFHASNTLYEFDYYIAMIVPE